MPINISQLRRLVSMSGGQPNIVIVDKCCLVRYNKTRLTDMLQALCKKFKLRKADITIQITDNTGIKKINRRFLNTSKNTDVISFDLSDTLDKTRTFDIIVNSELAKTHAKKLGHSAENELTLYILHGFLHNVGFDDLTDADARQMHRMEDKLLHKLGYGTVYAVTGERK